MNHRSTARLVEALAELRQFDKQNSNLAISLRPDLASQRRRLDIRVTELANAAGYDRHDLHELDDQVRALMLRRRSSQRRNVIAAGYDFSDMLATAGLSGAR